MASDKLFSDEYLDQLNPIEQVEQGPVTVFGLTFKNDEERRQYFREELRRRLPELRKIEGFPIGEDDDIINLSDPPYYTACPNPWLNDFIAQWEEEKKVLQREGKRKADFEVKEPYASDVSEGKYNPLYLLHPYLTKVPYPAIIKYIEHYTQPGDVVLDGFAGTGMTGAASRLSPTGKRKAICVDLSPLASFISNFVNSRVANSEFSQKTTEIISKAHDELKWMLETKHDSKTTGEISYVIWSNVYICPQCGSELVFYDVAFDNRTGDVHDSFICPHCSSNLSKSKCNNAYTTDYDTAVNDNTTTPKRVPVLIGYTVNKKRYQKRPDKNDIEILNKISSYDFPYWVPQDKIISGDEINRASRDGIKYFEQYYTKRSLAIFSKIKSLISAPIYNTLITKIAFQSTIMYRYCTKGGGPMSGTMYVPALIKELNIFNQIEAFVKDRAKIALSDEDGNVTTSTQSSTILSIRDNSIDYIFTDPPFGKNLMYSELNYLSEMWLKVKTNNKEECIECKTQSKLIVDYQKIIERVFNEYYRVLKPQKWMSIEFSNTSAAIWNAIQQAITSAGFVIANVSALDKKKESYKAVTTTTAVKQDLVITCYKPSNELVEKFNTSLSKIDNVWDFVTEHLAHLPIHIIHGNATTSVIERSPKILFDRLISYYVQNGYAIPIDAQEFQQGLREHYIERDGMFFTATQAAEYEEKKLKAPEFVPMGIIVSDEANGIEWLKNELRNNPQTRQDIYTNWTKAKAGVRKGDVIPELDTLLEENFIQNEDGTWRLANVEDDVDLEKLRTKALLKEFKLYLEVCRKPRGKLKDVRVEAVRAGFKQCYSDKNFADIILVGDRIPQNLLTEDEILLQYYDIASSKV